MANDTGSDDPKVVPLGKGKKAAEVQAQLGGDAADWTPREMLLAMLRDVDSGEIDPEAIFIAFRNKPGVEGTAEHPRYISRFRCCSDGDPHVTIGVVVQALLESYGRVDE